MTTDRFDALMRAFARTFTPSRRGLAGAVTGLALLGLGATEAKRRRKKKRKKKCKRCAPCQQCKKGTCKPKSEGADCGGNKVCQGGECVCPTACCSNDDCGFQGACESGVCDCKSGAKFCQGTCIPEEGCCTDDECADPRVCDGGECVCPSGQRECGAFCIPQERCCAALDCDSGESCLANNSCATACGPDKPPCPGSCVCGGGANVCRSANQPANICETPVCMSTGGCATGQACISFNCGTGRESERHCAALC